LGIEKKFFKIKQNRIQYSPSQNKKIDLGEATIIKTIYENRHFLNDVAEYLSPNLLKQHSEELQLLYQEEFENPKILDIVLRDEVLSLSYDCLLNNIRTILIQHIEKEISNIKFQNISMEEKSFKVRKLREKLQKLKKGELTI
jgi:DNA primase